VPPSPGAPPHPDLAWLQPLGIRTVFDIGANVGQFATRIHAVLPEAIIYAFEPLADCFETLKFRMREAERFRAFNVGLGDTAGERLFHRNNFSQSSSFLAMTEVHRRNFPFTARERLARARLGRLDDIAKDLEMPPHILVKIDVQGFEDRVIAGGRVVIEQARVALVEVSFRRLYEGQCLFEDVWRAMAGMGFRYGGALDQLKSPLDGEVLQADAIFINETPAEGGPGA
jgi:FkbM family methyltransferase